MLVACSLPWFSPCHLLHLRDGAAFDRPALRRLKGHIVITKGSSTRGATAGHILLPLHELPLSGEFCRHQKCQLGTYAGEGHG